MADESYVLPDEPVYREAIRKILNEDPVNADGILNPLIQALLENIHFVKLLAQAKAENSALDNHVGDEIIHITAAERATWDGKAEGNHSHTAADVGALASDGTAAAATKLATARTICTNLGITDTASFNGTANVTPGVTGTLPVAHGGTGGTTASAAKANLGIKDPKRTARFTVGTSASGWTADQVDYLCDGTADQVEINAAITALPSTGGEVVILDGTYNLTGSILVNKDFVTLSGNGQSTILKRAFVGTASEHGLIYITSSYNTIQDLSLDGMKSAYTITKNYGIYLESSSNNTISRNTCNNNCHGIYMFDCSNNTVIGNACTGNDLYSIYLNYCFNNIITGNICNEEASCILLSGDFNTITGNICNNNLSAGISISGSSNVISGNVCKNGSAGIFLSSGSNNTVTGNTCVGNSQYCIVLFPNANNNTVVGNTCICKTGTTSGYTINIMENANNNLIAANNIMGKNYTNSGTGNTFANNKYQ